MCTRVCLACALQAKARGIKDDPSATKDSGAKSDGDAKETPYDVGSLAHLPPAAGLQSILAVNRLRGFKLAKGGKPAEAGAGGDDADGAAVSLTYSQVRRAFAVLGCPCRSCHPCHPCCS